MQTPIYYINLASRPDRQQLMDEQLAAVSLKATRLNAKTTADVSPDMAALYCNPSRRQWMTARELACNLSHIEIWQTIIASGVDPALVLEDDVILSRSLGRVLDRIEQLAPPFDIIRIETLGHEVRPVEMEIAPGFGLRACLTRDAGAAGYAVTRKAAAFLLSRPERMIELVDAFLFNPHSRVGRSLSVRYLDRALCIQRSWIGEKLEAARSELESDRAERAAIARTLPLQKLARKFNGWINYDLPRAAARIRDFGSDTTASTIAFQPD